MKFTVFDDASGLVAAHLEMPDEDEARLNVEPGQTLFALFVPDDSYLKGGIVLPLPPRPVGPHWVFDLAGERWSDPRTPADLAAALYAAREQTSLDKSELLTRMLMSGLLPVSDIEAAGEGRIPPSLEPALAMLPPEAQVVARIKWRNDPIISRTNPVIVLAGAALGMSEEQLDALFGVVAPI